jgi:adenosine 3'-phospho 5'-phosphosulfate transporter B2
MRSPYGEEKEFFKYSLFIVFCNRLLTCSVCMLIILVRQEDMRPVAPLYKYAGVSLSNVLATSCQYEALKFVSFPVQTLAKCAKMIPVMLWGTVILRKKYGFHDYLVALVVTAGCTIFFLTGV